MLTFSQVMQTPVGPLVITANESAITAISFKNKGDNVPNDLTHACQSQLEQYFTGQRKQFSLPIQPEGTSFQHLVWSQLQEIPWGHTRTYGDIAEQIGNPKASRAVGMANNRNPIPIIIPCHRIIGKNGDLIGYSAGLEIKTQLLMLECQILPLDFGDSH